MLRQCAGWRLTRPHSLLSHMSRACIQVIVSHAVMHPHDAMASLPVLAHTVFFSACPLHMHGPVWGRVELKLCQGLPAVLLSLAHYLTGRL